MNPKISTSRVLSGNEVLAHAMRQIEPDVVAAYPITPTTHVIEVFAKFVADGKSKTEFVPVESEHSAMSACIGVAAAGGRAMTATASQGLALMHEVLFNASGMRLPIILLNGNRALSAPLSIHGDHSDAMAERDTGWIQLFAENPQEAYDLTIQAFRIGEHRDVRLPVMVCFDAFDTSHLTTNVKLVPDETVRKFLGETIELNPLFDTQNPVTYGAYTNPEYYFEFRRAQEEGFREALSVIPEVGGEYEKISGRNFDEHFETYETKDAETIFVILGSAAGVAREAAENLRAKKEKVGLLRLRTFRPFPAEDLIRVLKHAKNIIVLDRTMPAGAVGGPLFTELSSALQIENCKLKIVNFVYGLGQRDFFPSDAEAIYHAVKNGKAEKINFVNLRE